MLLHTAPNSRLELARVRWCLWRITIIAGTLRRKLSLQIATLSAQPSRPSSTRATTSDCLFINNIVPAVTAMKKFPGAHTLEALQTWSSEDLEGALTNLLLSIQSNPQPRPADCNLLLEIPQK